MGWKLEEEEDYFKIYDVKKNIAGYLDPDYGDADHARIERMLKNQDPVLGAFLMLPMVKFGIFDSGYKDVQSLRAKLEEALARTDAWRDFLVSRNTGHSIGVSHTDHDMLSVTIPVRFSRPVPLIKDSLLGAVSPILDQLQQLGLL